MPASASSEPRSEGRKTAVTDNYALSKNNGHNVCCITIYKYSIGVKSMIPHEPPPERWCIRLSTLSFADELSLPWNLYDQLPLVDLRNIWRISPFIEA